MMSTLLRRAILLAALTAGLAAVSLIGRAQTLGEPARFTALAVNMVGGGTASIEIAIQRWSTDAERDRLLSVLLDKGADKLLDVLKDAPKVGFIRNTSSIGWDLHFARHTPLPEGGERIVLATDRPIGIWEAANQPRTIDYPFTIIELRVNAEGEGEGKLSLATKIVPDKESGTVVLENYGIQPVLLQGVRRVKVTH